MRLLRCAPWELRDERAEGTFARACRRSPRGLRRRNARPRSAGCASGRRSGTGRLAGPAQQSHLSANDRYRNSTRAPGCPKFGESSVVDRPFFFNDEPSVKPGLHRRARVHSVVWWDPRTFNLAPPANLGLRRDEILLPDPDESESPSLTVYRSGRPIAIVSATPRKRSSSIFSPRRKTGESPKDFAVEVTHRFDR